MKINQYKEPVESSFKENKSFTIKASAKSFRILSSGLYSNKIKAVIRELSCNGLDSHTEAGKPDTPLEIHLPNKLEPWFYVRDFGLGMSHEDVQTIYSTYFESTKTNSNEVIGALGLGSKSPFSYTDAFSVVSIYNGVKRSYAVHIGVDGEPKAPTLVDELETDECNGFEVKMAVMEEDIERFCYTAEKVFRPFTVKPIIIGVRDFEFKEYQLTNKLGECQFFNRTNDLKDSICIQGNIEYPLDVSQFKSEELTPTAKGILNSNIILNFNIGELDIAASRESISYDPITKANILKKLESASKSLNEDMQTKLDEAKTRFEANLIVREFYNEIRIPMTGTYKGEELDGRGEIRSKDKSIIHYYVKNGRVFRENCIDRYSSSFSVRTDCTFIYNSEGRKNISRIRQKALEVGNVYMFESLSFISEIGNPEYIDASSLPKVVRSGRSVATKEKGLFFKKAKYRWNGKHFSGNYMNEESACLTSSSYYVVLDRYDAVTTYSFKDLLKLAASIGMIKETSEVIGIQPGYSRTKTFKARKNFLPFEEAVIKEFKKKYTSKKKLKELKSTANIFHISRSVGWALERVIKGEVARSTKFKNSKFGEVVKLYSKDIPTMNTDIIRFAIHLDLIQKPSTQESLLGTYPLLESVSSVEHEYVCEYVQLIDEKLSKS